MSPNIRRLNPQDPKDQQQLAKLEKQPDGSRIYLVSEVDPDSENNPEDILDEKASTKATLDHLGRLIIDQRIDVLHCDPHPDRVWIRGRIDGQLKRIGSLPTTNYRDLLNYLKIKANLDLADDVCQTSTVDWSFDDQTLSGQIQTVPTINGEKLTLWRQTEELGDNLGLIGFWGLGRRQLEQALGQTRGLILFVSHNQASRQLCLETTEAMLLANQHLSLASLTNQPTARHDHQTLVKPEWGRTRQQWLSTQIGGDNDVLAIDQLIDKSSCQLAVEAALNNKLVLSSLVGQSPDDTVDFLLSQGVDTHLLAAARPTIVAAHLVRRLKARPKPKRRPSPAEWLASQIWPRFGFDNQLKKVEQLIDQAAQAATEIGGQIDKPAKTGPEDNDYRGQILLTEVRPNQPLAGWPKTKDSPKTKREAVDLNRDGLIKICLGLTSPAEVERVISGRRDLSDSA